MSFSALNTHANTMHSRITPNNRAIWLMNVSTYPSTDPPYAVAYIIETTAPKIISIVIAFDLEYPNLVWIEKDKGSIVDNMLVRPAR